MSLLDEIVENFCQNKPSSLANELNLFSPKEIAPWLANQSKDHQEIILTYLPNIFVKEIIESLENQKAAEVLESLSLQRIEGIFSILEKEKYSAIIEHFGLQTKNYFQTKRHVAPDTLHHAQILPAITIAKSVSIEDALYACTRKPKYFDGEIFVCGSENKLVGRISILRLLSHSAKTAPLSMLVENHVQQLVISQSIGSALKHPGFESHNKLPVVDSKNILLGTIRYKALMDAWQKIPNQHYGIHEIAMGSVSSLFLGSLDALYKILLTNPNETNKNES